MLLQEQGRSQEALAQYGKLATLSQDVRNPAALVTYGDLLSADMVVQAHDGGRGDARPHRTMAMDAYARALRTQPAKTIGVSLLPGHRCWLCCNSTQTEVRARNMALACRRGNVGARAGKMPRSEERAQMAAGVGASHV